MDSAGVVELYSTVDGGMVGSGFLLADQLVLTARHVVVGADGREGECSARPLGTARWLPARLAHIAPERDVALLELLEAPESAAGGRDWLRWGVVDGTEPVACTAVGFPWSTARPGNVRDTEQLFGHIAPLAQRIA